MSYSIKQGHVLLTIRQFRDIITILEVIRSIETGQEARVIANESLEHLKRENLLSEVACGYPDPPTLPWEIKPALEERVLWEAPP